MGGLHGNITLGWLDQELSRMVKKVQVISINLSFVNCAMTKSLIQVEVGGGKILGVATLEDEKVVVSCEERRLVMLGRDGEVEGEGSLPPSSNCWMTAATSWGDLIVVGGRSGGLHCFSSGLACLVASWSGLHGKQGVTALVAEDRSSLWSAGRDGKIRRLGRRDGGVEVFVSISVDNQKRMLDLICGRVLSFTISLAFFSKDLYNLMHLH